MGIARRSVWILAAVLALAGAMLPLRAVASGSRTVTIGVDHRTPRGHNFEYVDFFPRHDTRVHAGDVLNFLWGLTPDGLHNVHLLRTGETPAQAYQERPFVVPDADDGPAQLQLNPAVLSPADPSCGTAATPCAFDGSDLNSGAKPTDGKNAFLVKLNVPPGTTVRYVCEIHHNMQGSVRVVRNDVPRTPVSVVRQRANAQARADTKAAFKAERAANHVSVIRHNPDGTRTLKLIAGTAAAHVEVAEMLPQRVHIKAGDQVRFKTRTLVDPHTVTFPSGSEEAEPLPEFCESPSGDVSAEGQDPPCGGDLSLFEVHFDPQPVGPTAVTAPDTVASSGVIGPPASPLPLNYTFSFPNRGTFGYFCHIHPRQMVGTLVVR